MFFVVVVVFLSHLLMSDCRFSISPVNYPEANKKYLCVSGFSSAKTRYGRSA